MTGATHDEGPAHDPMPPREQPREQKLQKRTGETLRQRPARHQVFDAVLVQAPLDTGCDNAMTVPPLLERPPELLVAELSPVDVAVVACFPSHPQRSDAEGESDARAVAQPLLLTLNPDPPSQRRQIKQRLWTLVPSKHVTGPTGHDGPIHENRAVCG